MIDVSNISYLMHHLSEFQTCPSEKLYLATLYRSKGRIKAYLETKTYIFLYTLCTGLHVCLYTVAIIYLLLIYMLIIIKSCCISVHKISALGNYTTLGVC